ncbi:MAG: YncE family protein [Nitrosopumilus sp.]|nr:YncE family protein [Nitrosopumilus sp.]
MIFLLILVLSIIIPQLMPDILAEENTVIATISVGDKPNDIAFDSANNRMYVTNYHDDTVSVINTATNAVDATVTTAGAGGNGNTPHGIAFDSANNRMYYAIGNWMFVENEVSVINTANNLVIATITVGDNPEHFAFDSANNRMYVTNYNDDTVSVINTANNSVIATVSVGDGPGGIAFDSANNRMYVLNGLGDTVSVINTATNAVDATISVGDAPISIAFDSANNRMYVVNANDDTVSVIDIAPDIVVEETKKSSSDCYDCEAPKLTKVEVHVSSSPFDYVWNFEQDTPYPMFGDDITPIVADPGDEVEIILELTDNRTLKRVYDSATYTNFLTKPNDMNTFYANNFDEYGKVSTTYYEWHQTGEDLVYDYDNTVEWSEADVPIQESGEFAKDGPAENLDGLVGTFTISFKMKFLQPMQTSDVYVQATDRSGNFFKVALPLTLKVSGNEPLVFESKVNQKVLSFYDESMLYEMVSDWNGSSQDVSELAAILGIPDEQLDPWVANLAVWVSEDRITVADMIVAIEYLINN